MDWQRWHEAYDDPGSSLSRRLVIVRHRLHEVLDRAPAGEIGLLSLCGGDARDVVPVLRDHPAGHRVRAVVVELDEELAGAAGAAAEEAGLANVEVRCADVVPVDVLLLCGVFGNVEHEAVRDLVGRIPSMVRAGGHVIWTRGAASGDDDPRDDVRRWFAEAGMPEVSFDGAPEVYGVGVNRVPQPAAVPLGEARLFTFVQ